MHKQDLKTPKGIPRASGYQQAGVTKSQGLPTARGYQQSGVTKSHGLSSQGYQEPGVTKSNGLPIARGYQQTGVTNSRNSKENYKIVNRKGQNTKQKTKNWATPLKSFNIVFVLYQ